MSREVGRYQILEQIGQGGMATVYKAYDPKIDRTLAIKALREERCADAEYRQRFLREATAAGILSHPNIVTVYDVGEVENTPYIAMELLQGTPLDQVMKGATPLTLSQVLRIGIELGEALDYAHNNGIVHRDIKPSNIILGNDGNIKITDFGIARLESNDMTHQTQMGEVLGTPQYMSPEQVLGKTVDGRSDLFSVGVILYQLLSGQKPFKGETLATLLFQIATENPQPIGQFVPALPASLKQIIDKLLKKQPEKRFQKGKDLADGLRRVLKDFEEHERTAGAARIVPLRVKWAGLMAGAVALTMLICSLFIYQKQNGALTTQVLNFGSSLVKFAATESAEPVLSEDWTAIELFVQDAMARQEFKYLTIVDHKGIVRGHSNADLIGKPFPTLTDAAPIADVSGVKVMETDVAGGETVLDFQTPIIFQNTAIGHVHLGLPRAPLDAVANLTMLMMGILLVATIVAVAVVAYVFGKTLAKPIEQIQTAMQEISEGRFSYRIAIQRKDEFGQLFLGFDKMAENLQKRDEKETALEAA